MDRSRAVSGAVQDSARSRRDRWLTLVALFPFFLFFSRSVSALSLDDILRLTRDGYTDQEILEVVRVTKTPFDLDSNGTKQLREAGVSESVIEALIRLSSNEGAVNSGVKPSGPDTRRPAAVDSRHEHDEDSLSALDAPATSEHGANGDTVVPIRQGWFSFFPFHETGGEHSASHQHQAVAISGLAVFVLRSEAGYASVDDRAREVVARINHVIRERPGGTFFSSAGSYDGVWYGTTESEPPRQVLTVTRGDVIAYQRRSLGSVSRERLASYWAALLNDFVRIFIVQRPPIGVSTLHSGEVLGRLYELLNATGDGHGQPIENGSTRVLRAVDHLTGEDKEHLLELAIRVPAEFKKTEVAPAGSFR